jgi:hypothetical protein
VITTRISTIVKADILFFILILYTIVAKMLMLEACATVTIMDIGKQMIRSGMRNILKSMSDVEIQSASNAIRLSIFRYFDTILRPDIKIHIYRTSSSWIEVDTAGIIETLHERSIEPTDIDVPEVASDAPIPTRQYNVIFVPCLGFDEELNRLGRGSGWYDKFLGTQRHAIKIGVAFEATKYRSIPYEEHDVKLDFIVTESNIYTSQGNSA